MKIPGIYVLHGPCGVYVGESSDCLSRRALFESLGLMWGIAREMPNSTKSERRRMEHGVADAWASRGWAVVSRNTSAHKDWHYAAVRQALKIHPSYRAARSKNGKQYQAQITHEQRVSMGQNGRAGLSREDALRGSRIAGALRAALPANERSAIVRRGWQTRRCNKEQRCV